MAGTKIKHDIALIVERRGGAAPPAGGGDGGGRGPQPGAASPSRYYTGISIALAAIVMFFMALTSAYVILKGVNSLWQQVTLPPILWVNTVVLFVSSLTIELARRRLARSDFSAFRALWKVTTGLGLLFLAGQLLAWRQLVAAGAYLSSNTASSFFYILTAAHALHLLGGIIALAYVAVHNFDRGEGVSRVVAANVAAIYWHFMDGLWVYLLALLYFVK
ncbi:MAG: cytochrome c oxidase subunit 3 [Acidobacteriia bacterium]|nr:cytochrome c oxidase subunit 3 [Terriglobia bacterium]